MTDLPHPGRDHPPGGIDYPGPVAKGQEIERRGDDRHGLSFFDGVLIIGGGVIALFVAFGVLHFIAGVIWFFVKVVIVVALIAIVARLVFRRRS